MSHLGGGVNSSIGSTGAVQRHGMIENTRKYVFDFLLYRAIALLPLPPMKMSAQVLNYQGDSLLACDLLSVVHFVADW
jgi:hypothetical protein